MTRSTKQPVLWRCKPFRTSAITPVLQSSSAACQRSETALVEPASVTQMPPLTAGCFRNRSSERWKELQPQHTEHLAPQALSVLGMQSVPALDAHTFAAHCLPGGLCLLQYRLFKASQWHPWTVARLLEAASSVRPQQSRLCCSPAWQPVKFLEIVAVEVGPASVTQMRWPS